MMNKSNIKVDGLAWFAVALSVVAIILDYRMAYVVAGGVIYIALSAIIDAKSKKEKR